MQGVVCRVVGNFSVPAGLARNEEWRQGVEAIASARCDVGIVWRVLMRDGSGRWVTRVGDVGS